MAEPTRDVQIIGAIDPARAIDIEAIRETLAARQQPLAHGAAFTGRPATLLHVGVDLVVKLRSDLAFSPRDSARWCERTLERERALGVHHPAKTWFVLAGGARPAIGNAAPRLLPLNQAERVLAPERMAGLAEELLRMYLEAAATHERRLDEGLSNFGIDAGGALFYLDDDVYDWDGFVSIAQMLGVLLRGSRWLTEPLARSLGHAIRNQLIAAFGDSHTAVVLAEQLRSVYIAEGAPSGRRDALVEALRPPRRARPRPSLSAGRIGVLADIHANLSALDAVLAALDREGVARGIVLGDVVGYGPHPRECIERLRERELVVIRGNHDHAAVLGAAGLGFSTAGLTVIRWTHDALGPAEREWLDGLEPYWREPEWLAVHGAPIDRTFFNAYVYRRTFEDNLAGLAERGIRVCFHGHTHVPGVYFQRRGVADHADAQAQSLRDYDQALVCPGSVGQPRSGVPGAEYALYDNDSGRLDFRRVAYDVRPVVEAMRSLAFPQALIERLQRCV